MDRASDLASGGAPPGMVVVADHQSAGRGTHGRRWLAPPHTCLMFTAVLRPRGAVESLPNLPGYIAQLIAGVLTERLGVDVDVVYPNDLMVDGRKICGVLCQSRVYRGSVVYVLCGVGLNTFMREDQLPLRDATSLYLCGVDVPSHEQLLEWLLEALVDFR